MKNSSSGQIQNLKGNSKGNARLRIVAPASIRITIFIVVALNFYNSACLAQWVPGYAYKAKITIDGSQICGASTLSDFPILVNLSGDIFKSAPTGLITNPAGYDIVFTDTDQTTVLNHEIESYNGTAGTYSAWVKIPTLTSGMDFDLYVYYGNNSIVTNPSSASTWQASFRTIYHFNNNLFTDATSNGIHAVDNGTTNTVGKIGDARDFDGVTAYVQSSSNDLATENNFTISVWFKADAVNPAHIIWQGLSSQNGWGNGVGGAQEMNLSTGTCCPGSAAQSNFLSYFLGDREEQIATEVLSVESAFTDVSSWQYAVATVSNLDSNPLAEFFLNGTSIGTNAGITSIYTARDLWDTNLRIGSPGAATRFFDGQADEVRISNTVRPAEWVCTEYNNQNNPAAFSALVNHPPDLAGLEGAALNFTEGDATTPLTSSIVVSDWEQPTISGAVVQITSNYVNGEDVLAFTNAFGITASYDPSTGTLTLSGNATTADYQSALRSVTYQNVNGGNPSSAIRTVSFTVNDGTDNSISATRNITVNPVNDPPVLASIEVSALSYSEDQIPAAVTSSITVSDLDNTTISSATIRMTTNYVNGQDVLSFTNTPFITGNFVAATGTLSLTGAASIADYQSALRSITYHNTNSTAPATTTRTVTFVANDGSANSNVVMRDITVATVNDPPVLSAIEITALNYNEGQAATTITSTVIASDVDHTLLSGATIEISGNYLSTEDVLSFTNASGITGTVDSVTGILTLAGSSSITNYRNAIRSVRYQNTNINNPSSLPRTITFRVTDGVNYSNAVSRILNVVPLNDAPVLTGIEGASMNYTEEQVPTAITSTLSIADVDNSTIGSATVQITSGYSSAEDVLAFTSAFGISGTFNTGSGLLTLTGIASLADYELALRSVTYQNTNTGNPSNVNRIVSFRVSDGSANSNTVTRTITVTRTNDAPILSAIEPAALSYSEGAAATAITSAINITDADHTNIAGAYIQITGNYLSSEDLLTFTNASGISGSYDPSTGTMTLTGTTTLTNYRNALRTVRYRNTNNNNPSALVRTVSFSVTDGVDYSSIVTRDIALAPVNDAPVLSAIEGTALPYTEDQGPAIITGTIVVNDVDNTAITGATVQITVAYSSTQDVLAFSDAYGITSTFNTSNGMLTMTGSATVADYEAALRSVTYENTNTLNPSTSTRTVTFRVNDGTANSNTQTRTITIALINDAPILSAIEGSGLAYLEGQAATAITSTIVVTDLDNANLSGATIQIAGNYIDTEDILTFTNGSGITGLYDALTGTMTLSGSSSVTNYRNALRGVRYRNTNNATPSGLVRTVSYSVSDASLSSNIVTRDIIVSPVNDVPVAVNESVGTVEETDIVIDVLDNDTDVDNTIDITTVTIVSQPANGTVSVNGTTGEVTYSPNVDFSGINTFTYNVKDVSGGISNTATVTVNVSNINDIPAFTAGPDVVVNEDAGTQTINGWATGINDGDPFTNQTLTFVLTNTNNSLFSSQPSVNAAGNLTFRSANNAVGTATVTIYVRDNGLSTPPPNVNQSGTQTFTITVHAVNDAPNAVDDFYSTSSNTPLTASMRSNDTDAEGNILTASPVPVINPSFGSVVINSTGTFTYTPNGSYTGTDTFTYEICDNGTDHGNVAAPKCSQAVVSITVNPPNDVYNIVGNNSIELSTHCFILTKALNNQQGAVWHRAPLDLRYSFELNFDTMFSDSSVVRDTGADGIIFLLQRDYTPPPLNDPGSPIHARGSVGEYLGVGGISPSIGIEVDTYQNGGEPAYDHIAISRDGSVYNIVSPPVPAKVDPTNAPVNIEDGLTHTVRITWDRPSSTLQVYFDNILRTTYTSDIINNIFQGDPTNIYWGFSASTGGQNNYQAVCGIDMVPINLAPQVTGESSSTNEDTAVSGTVLGNDVDPEGGNVTATAETKVTPHGQVVILADGQYTYTPNADYNGTDTFNYEVCDQFQTPGCTQGSVAISIAPLNDAPRPIDDLANTPEESSVVIDILGNDVDIDNAIDPTTVVIVNSPAHGSALIDAATGHVTYLPHADYSGSDNFTYTVKDLDGAVSNPAQVTVNVSPINDAPVLYNDNATTRQVAVIIDVLSNDTDIENTVNPTSITILTNPVNGTVSVNALNGQVTYAPNADFLGDDIFTYECYDMDGLLSNIATVTVRVTPANRPPVANPDGPITFSLLLPITIDVLQNDNDPDHATGDLIISSVTQPETGTVSIENGKIIYTPSGLSESKTFQFTYTIQDPEGLTGESTVTLEFIYQPLAISEGFSPNGDGSNDYWYIRSIENYPGNVLKVFNRWGLLVYSCSNYDNTSTYWDGRANTGQESSKLVDQGTYFYTLELGNNSKSLSGFVVIVR